MLVTADKSDPCRMVKGESDGRRAGEGVPS